MQPNRPACVLHADRPAVFTVQGIVVCAEDYEAYREEYLRGVQTSNLTLRSRPVLQALIAASSEANFPEKVVDN